MSIVPILILPEAIRSLIYGTFSDNQISLKRLKYDETGKPVNNLKSPYFFLKS